MTNLTVLNGGQANEELYLTSIEVAEMTGKRHDHLIRDIDNYVSVLGQNPKLGADKFFVESSYIAGTGKNYKQYLLTRKGCDMVANKMTGEKVKIHTTINNTYGAYNWFLTGDAIPYNIQVRSESFREKFSPKKIET
ncbi:hypothetical protein IIW_00320 [Bacillus cereus VD136]|nr:hypothetical protein IIW_00320 [Bacillus cereus VD136]